MKILSIETSCDETALSVLEAEGNFGSENNPAKFKILANNLISQIDLHKQYGGVFPALAKREHSKNLIPLLAKSLAEAKLSNPVTKSPPLSNRVTKWVEIEKILEREPELLKLFLEYIPTIETPPIDVITVTQGPGLEPALWVGVNFAKALSLVWNKPLIPINHMEGHLLASLVSQKSKVKSQKIEGIKFPAIGLLISGGHTELILIENWMQYKKIGQTLDDAVGEAFDKAARMMNLSYPGGPEISKLAQIAREKNEVVQTNPEIKLPRPMLNTDDFNFSFSGLKTAVLYLVKNLKEKNNWEELPLEVKQQISQEFEDVVVEVLLKKTQRAIETFGAQTLILGGGVVANSQIRQAFQSLGKTSGGSTSRNLGRSDFSKLRLKVLMPEIEFSTDNAIMIGIAGYFQYLKLKGQLQTAIDLKELKVDGNLGL